MIKLHKYAFADLYDISSGISSTKEQAGHGAPFVSFSTVFNNYFLPGELPDLMDTSAVDQEKCSVKKGDILITRTSETVDELAMSCVVLNDYPKATFSGFVKRLRPKKTGIAYDKYMAFFLRSEYFRKVINAKTIMTLRASFNEDIFSFLDLYLPDYEEQVKIGDFLYNIEKKIQCNRNINDNLQHQLKLMYDYWFTQFDFPDENGKPYRSSGGDMVWCDKLKRNIPKNWTHGMLKDILVKLTDGISSDDKMEYRYTPIDTLTSYQISFYQTGNQDDANSSLIRYKKYTILFGAMRPYFHRVCIAPFDGITRTTVFTLQEKYEDELGYAYETINQDYVVNYATAHHVGTQQPYAEWENNLDECPIPLPPHHIRAKYSIIAKPIIEQALTLCLENERLTNLRDWLMPMLMNGQATISD